MPVLRLLPLVLSVGLVAGCGLLPGSSDGTPRERFSDAVADVRAAVEEEVERAREQAQASAEQDSGDIAQGDAPQVDAIRTDTNTAFDYEQYTSTLEQVIGSLEQFWGERLPADFGVAFTPPSRYSYYRSDQGGGPSCGGSEAPPRNAFYCTAGDFIAWDETGLLIPYYVQAGDFAAAFVLAHEFGHAMQARLPEQDALPVILELQADASPARGRARCRTRRSSRRATSTRRRSPSSPPATYRAPRSPTRRRTAAASSGPGRSATATRTGRRRATPPPRPTGSSPASPARAEPAGRPGR